VGPLLGLLLLTPSACLDLPGFAGSDEAPADAGSVEGGAAGDGGEPDRDGGGAAAQDGVADLACPVTAGGVAITRDEQRVAALCEPGGLQLYSLPHRSGDGPAATLAAPGDPFVAFALAPTTRAAVTLEGDGNLRIWDLEVGTEAPFAPVGLGPPTGPVSFNLDGDHVVTVVGGTAVVARPWRASGEVWREPGIDRGTEATFIGPDHDIVVVEDPEAGRIRFLRSASGRWEAIETRSLEAGPHPCGEVRCLGTSLGSDRFAVCCGSDGGLRAGSIHGGTAVERLLADDDPIDALAFTPAGDLLAGTAGRYLLMWETDGGTRVLRREVPPLLADGSSLAFSMSGRLLAVRRGGRLVVVEVPDGIRGPGAIDWTP